MTPLRWLNVFFLGLNVIVLKQDKMVMLGKIKNNVKSVFTVLSTSEFLSPKTLGIIRHVVTIIGSLLLVKGVADVDSIHALEDKIIAFITSANGLVGDFLILVSMVSSYFAKEKQ